MAAATLLALIASSPALGTAEGRCRPHEPGPAIIVEADGLKDRTGTLRLELYPAVKGDFLADDNVLVAAGKTFHRVVLPVPPAGAASLCIRAPAVGRYALSLTHDRVGRPKFDLDRDGIGFANNPKLGLGAPPVGAATVTVGPGLTTLRIVLNYRTGLFRFGPLEGTRR